MLCFFLEFEGTNNVVEYEALLLGLNLAKDLGINILKIIGDSDLVVSQVKGIFASKNERLKRYRNAVWDAMEWFDALSLIVEPRDLNERANAVAISPLMTLQICDDLMKNGKLEVIFRPSVPDNFINWTGF
jgi:ribonuclease HI